MERMTDRQNFWGGWQERISALRNVPAVLKIVWDSGPAVVVFGLISRLLSSLMPVALLWITKLIIEGIVHAVSAHQPVSRGFWWLVVAGASRGWVTHRRHFFARWSPGSSESSMIFAP